MCYIHAESYLYHTSWVGVLARCHNTCSASIDSDSSDSPTSEELRILTKKSLNSLMVNVKVLGEQTESQYFVQCVYSQEQTPRSHTSTGKKNFPWNVWLNHSLRRFNNTWPNSTGQEIDLRVKTASVKSLKLVQCGGNAQPESHGSGQRRDRIGQHQCTCCGDCCGAEKQVDCDTRFVVCPRDASQNSPALSLLYKNGDITVFLLYYQENTLLRSLRHGLLITTVFQVLKVFSVQPCPINLNKFWRKS